MKVLALVIAASGLIACNDSKPGMTPVAATSAVVPAPRQIDPRRTDLMYRFLDRGGEVGTAMSLDAVPVEARKQVVVYDPKADLPAGWDLVANLSDVKVAKADATGTAIVATPIEHFSFTTRAMQVASTEAPTIIAQKQGAHEVLMFSTEGCGYCAKARSFFADKRIPYTEMDLEEDAKAPRMLSMYGQKAGLTARDLQGVPIFFIDGAPVLGWDPARIETLLGEHG